MFRKIPPIAFPVETSDFFNVLKYLYSGNALTAFEKRFAKVLNLSHCVATSSGRAALTLALMALKEIAPGKRDVIIPAYTCPTVPLSVARAGLKVKLCDISSDTLNMDVLSLGQLIDENTLCVVVAHMFGFPCDMERILKIVSANDIFLIEDVAQAAGAKWKGRMLGAFGNLSCFSLGRGKSLTTYEGGILCINKVPQCTGTALEWNNFASQGGRVKGREISILGFDTQATQPALLNPRAGRILNSAGTFVKLLSMSFLQGSHAWWFMSKLPLGFEQQYHSIDFKIGGLSNWQAAFGLSVLERLNSINAVRTSNGKILTQRLQDLKAITIPQALADAEAVYLRLPVIVKDKQLREKIYRRLHKAGIGVSKMYVSSLNRYDYLADIVPGGDYPVAEYVADRIIALPTHPLVSKEDLELIVDIFRKAVNEGS